MLTGAEKERSSIALAGVEGSFLGLSGMSLEISHYQNMRRQSGLLSLLPVSHFEQMACRLY